MSVGKTLADYNSLMHERAVSHVTTVSIKTLQRWRLLKKGPKFIRIGSLVRYRPEDVDAWLASRSAGGSDQ